MADDRLHIRIEPELLRETKSAADRKDQDLSRYVRAALREKNARESAGKKRPRDNRTHKC